MLLGKNKKGDSALLDEPVFYDGVGADLRAVRERQALSIADVAGHLMIQARYLETIEAGEFENLPGPAYAVGFVQSYANLLGLDATQAVSLFKQETSGKFAVGELDFPQPLDESRRTSPLLILLILVIVAGGYGGWVFLKRSGMLDPALPKIEVPKGGGKNAPQPKKSALPEPKRLVQKASLAGASLNRASVDKVAGKITGAPADNAAKAGGGNPGATAMTAAAGGKLAETAGTEISKREPERAGEKTPVPAALKAKSDAAFGAANRPTKTVAGATAKTVVKIATNDTAATTSTAAKTAVKQIAPALNSQPKLESGNIAAKSLTPVPQVTKTAKIADERISGTQTGVGVKLNPAVGGDIEKLAANPTAPAPTLKTTRATTTVAEKMAPTASPAVNSASLVTGRTPQIFGAVNKNARVVVIAHRDAWIQVKGRRNELLLTRMLYPGDRYLAPNRQDVLLTVGNAGAIEIRLDGKKLASLGALGVVRRNVPLAPEKLRKFLP